MSLVAFIVLSCSVSRVIWKSFFSWNMIFTNSKFIPYFLVELKYLGTFSENDVIFWKWN